MTGCTYVRQVTAAAAEVRARVVVEVTRARVVESAPVVNKALHRQVTAS